jgi:hypothetical protein
MTVIGLTAAALVVLLPVIGFVAYCRASSMGAPGGSETSSAIPFGNVR